MVEAVWYHQPWVEGKCKYDECLQKWLELAEVEQMMCEDGCTPWWQGRGPAFDYRLDCRAWAPGPLVRWPPLEKVEWSNSTSLQSPVVKTRAADATVVSNNWTNQGVGRWWPLESRCCCSPRRSRTFDARGELSQVSDVARLEASIEILLPSWLAQLFWINWFWHHRLHDFGGITWREGPGRHLSI